MKIRRPASLSVQLLGHGLFCPLVLLYPAPLLFRHGSLDPADADPRQAAYSGAKTDAAPVVRRVANDREIAILLEEFSSNLAPCCGTQRLTQSFWALQTINGGRPAVPALIRWLKAGGPTPLAVYYIEEVGPQAEDAIPDLVELLTAVSKHPEERTKQFGGPRWICDILGSIGPRAKCAVPLLTLYVNEERDERVRLAATVAVIRIDGVSSATDGALLLLSASRDPRVRCRVAGNIGRLGVQPPALKRTLTTLLSDEEPKVRIAASRRLWELFRDSEPSVSTLTKILEQPPGLNSDHTDALKLLGTIGAEARAAIPAIHQFTVRGQDGFARDVAFVALLRIQGPSSELERRLAASLEARPINVLDRFTASTLLELKGPLRDQAIQAIGQIADGKSEIVLPEFMFETIDGLRQQAAPLVATLIRILGDKDPFQRQMAARALGQIGPPAYSAALPLRELAEQEDLHVRLQALDSIAKIQIEQNP